MGKQDQGLISTRHFIEESGSLKIKIPFPPVIDVKDLIDSRPKRDKTPRCPNAFIIYRKVYSETARNEGYYLPMTVVSSLASKSWEKEPLEVQEYYKQLAKEAFKYRNEKFPKAIKRKKKKTGWNVISFHVPTNLEAQNTAKKEDRTLQFQKDLEDVIDFREYATPELSSNVSTATSSPITDQLFQVEEGMIQNVYPSPNPSIHGNTPLNFTSQSFENFLPLQPLQPLQESEIVSIDKYRQNEQRNQTEVYQQNYLDASRFDPSVTQEFNISSSPEFNQFSQNISLNDEIFGSNDVFNTFGIIIPNNEFSVNEFTFSNFVNYD